MLTEKERAGLAPSLVRVREIRAERDAAAEVTRAAETLLDESERHSGWRDRWLGGRCSREPARAAAYRTARQAWGSAAAASSKLTKQASKLEQELDKHIEPVMPKLDPKYRHLAEMIERYEKALKPCRNLQTLITKATEAAHAAIDKPRRNDKDHEAAASARRRYASLIAQAHGAIPAAQLALYSLSQSTAAWDEVRLDRLPAIDHRSALEQLARADAKVRRPINRLTALQKEARAAQQRALQATRELLINDQAYRQAVGL